MLRFVARVLIARQHDFCQTAVEVAIHSGTFGPKPPSAERVLGDGSSVGHFPELRHLPASALRSAGCLAPMARRCERWTPPDGIYFNSP